MKKLIPFFLLLALIVFAGSIYVNSITSNSPEPASSYSKLLISSQKQQESKDISSHSSEPEKESIEYHFRNKNLRSSHFDKHGKQMGFSSRNEYEKAASRVINNPNALTKTEKEDGDFVFYLEETNEFVILSTDGYIRTYFLPDAGKAYFDRQ